MGVHEWARHEIEQSLQRASEQGFRVRARSARLAQRSGATQQL
jgi:hypothetical protein